MYATGVDIGMQIHMKAIRGWENEGFGREFVVWEMIQGRSRGDLSTAGMPHFGRLFPSLNFWRSPAPPTNTKTIIHNDIYHDLPTCPGQSAISSRPSTPQSPRPTRYQLGTTLRASQPLLVTTYTTPSFLAERLSSQNSKRSSARPSGSSGAAMS